VILGACVGVPQSYIDWYMTVLYADVDSCACMYTCAYVFDSFWVLCVWDAQRLSTLISPCISLALSRWLPVQEEPFGTYDEALGLEVPHLAVGCFKDL